MKKTLNLTELAEYIDIPKRTLFDMIRDGRFPVQPIVRSTPRIWSTEQIDQWLRGDTK
jgi:predicted DNA-binding transcriptional regulator AlpA